MVFYSLGPIFGDLFVDSSLSFDDVLIKPKFSTITSRKDVNISVTAFGQSLLPIISSNMDTVTGSEMTHAMFNFGGLAGPGARGCLHRFWSVEDNVKAFKESAKQTWVSIGLGEDEINRAKALYDAGAVTFVIDVAHGASSEVVKQVKLFRQTVGGMLPSLIVGNFATAESIQDFLNAVEDKYAVNGFKVGIGGGSACTTRVVTGCGVPTLGSLVDCSKVGVPLIADGGIRTSGDVAKALAVPNVKAVMLGGMLAGTNEAPGEPIYGPSMSSGCLQTADFTVTHKKYRGSASKESYTVQNKDSSWRTAEGEAFLVPYKGPVKDVLQQIEAGVRSAFSYVGAKNLKEFQEKAEFITVTSNGLRESRPHGKST
jgi:IMP dehydrogenase